MLSNKILKTILPVAFGYFASWSFSLFWKYFNSSDPHLEREIELSTPGIVFALEYLLNFIGPMLLIIFQYFVIVPATIVSTKKAFLVSLSVGFGISFLFCLQMLKPGVPITLKDFVLALTGFFLDFESYFIINLATITFLNRITPKVGLKVNSVP